MKYIGFALFLLYSGLASGQTSYKELFGDSIKEIYWSCGIAYLPSPQSEFVELKATPRTLKTKHMRYTRWNRSRGKREKHAHLSKRKFAEMYDRYNALREPLIDFALMPEDKDTLRYLLKDTTYTGDLKYKLTSEQLEKYLAKDTLQLDVSVFEIDSVLAMFGMVIDGAPFRFRMLTISLDNDTTEYMYQGNLFGSDRFRDLSKFFVFSSIYTETPLFEGLPFDVYFSRTNVLRTILWYLEGKEGLLEFKPFELIWEGE